jgi:hypothetical protein
MENKRVIYRFAPLALMGLLLSACGGGGSADSSTTDAQQTQPSAELTAKADIASAKSLAEASAPLEGQSLSISPVVEMVPSYVRFAHLDTCAHGPDFVPLPLTLSTLMPFINLPSSVGFNQVTPPILTGPSQGPRGVVASYTWGITTVEWHKIDTWNFDAVGMLPGHLFLRAAIQKTPSPTDYPGYHRTWLSYDAPPDPNPSASHFVVLNGNRMAINVRMIPAQASLPVVQIPGGVAASSVSLNQDLASGAYRVVITRQDTGATLFDTGVADFVIPSGQDFALLLPNFIGCTPTGVPRNDVIRVQAVNLSGGADLTLIDDVAMINKVSTGEIGVTPSTVGFRLNNNLVATLNTGAQNVMVSNTVRGVAAGPIPYSIKLGSQSPYNTTASLAKGRLNDLVGAAFYSYSATYGAIVPVYGYAGAFPLSQSFGY